MLDSLRSPSSTRRKISDSDKAEMGKRSRVTEVSFRHKHLAESVFSQIAGAYVGEI